MTTKCGTSGVNAFYCAADQQVYYCNQLRHAVPIVRRDKWAADVVMAHEFGHALQARTGILISATRWARTPATSRPTCSTAAGWRPRRTASPACSSARSRPSLGVQQSDLRRHRGHLRRGRGRHAQRQPDIVGNHGCPIAGYWGTTGLGTRAVGKCNTFTSPAQPGR